MGIPVGKILNLLFALDIGGRLAGIGTKAFTGKSISELAGLTQTGERASSLRKQVEELEKQQLFRDIRQERIGDLLPQSGLVSDDPIGLARDDAELNLLFNEILPFIGRTGRPLGDVLGDRGGQALRALLSDKDRRKLDGTAEELSLPKVSDMSREQILGIAASPTPPPTVGPPAPVTPPVGPPAPAPQMMRMPVPPGSQMQ